MKWTQDPPNDASCRSSQSDFLRKLASMMATHQQFSSGDDQNERAGSYEANAQRIPVVKRGNPGMTLVEAYLSSLKRLDPAAPSYKEAQAAFALERGTPPPSHLFNAFQNCPVEHPDLERWPCAPARQDTSGASMPLPGHHHCKRQRSCPADDQEDVAESMPWGPAERLTVPDCARQPSYGAFRGRDHSSLSAASTHWQVQVWPQPTFRVHRDVLEDDATSPFSAARPKD